MIDERDGHMMILKELKKHIKDDDGEDQYDEESFIMDGNGGEQTIKQGEIEVETRTSLRGSLINKV